LPKQIGSTGWIWLVLLLGVVVTGCLWLRVDPAPLDRFDAWVTDIVVSFRTGWLDALARQAHTIGSRVGFALLGLLLVLTTAWFRRWRHLVDSAIASASRARSSRGSNWSPCGRGRSACGNSRVGRATRRRRSRWARSRS
jgi:hypothetical protein